MVQPNQNPLATPSSVDDLLAAVTKMNGDTPEKSTVDTVKVSDNVSDVVANPPEDVDNGTSEDTPTEPLEYKIPAGYTLIRYNKGGWLGFLFEGDRYSVGVQPVAVPDAVAKFATSLYQGQIVPA